MALSSFAVRPSVGRAWRRYVDGLVDSRPALHAYCYRLTGNVWDGEDLVQDTLVRVFCVVGRTDATLENPRAYLIRTATNLWIDRVRRSAREQAALALERAEPATASPVEIRDGDAAVRTLFKRLHAQERAAFLLKDVFDLSLEETADVLQTSVGAVKSALARARGRLEGRRPLAGLDAPPGDVVQRFTTALRTKDLDAMKALCAEQVVGELVGGAELATFAKARQIFVHAHIVMPRLGFGEHPRWEVAEYEGEPIVLGFRTLDGVEGLNEVHRLEVLDGLIVRVRTYCFCPETLVVVADAIGARALPRPYRSPSLRDVLPALVLGFRAR
jgi:RNA polymerase sigma-70 factor (ECF subfamily)